MKWAARIRFLDTAPCPCFLVLVGVGWLRGIQGGAAALIRGKFGWNRAAKANKLESQAKPPSKERASNKMKTTGFKNLVIGMALGVLLVVSVAATGKLIRSGPHGIGRFQLGGSGTSAFVIDTVTGQVWQQGVENFAEIKMAPIAPREF